MRTKEVIRMAIISLFLAILSTSAMSQVVINEYSVSNLNQFPDNYQSYEDWVELYNSGSTTADISNYYLSDKEGNPTKWQFPEGTQIQAGGYLIVWFSGRNEAQNNHYHTNFRLTQTKDDPEYILLSDASATIINNYQLENTQQGHSRGRRLDGSETWAIFTTPTAGATNNLATKYSGYAQKPGFNMSAGFYDSSISVTISNNEPDAVIRYTTNGTLPTTTSAIYSSPITINATQVLKARCFSNNTEILPSLVEFSSYFINEDHTIPVVSIAADDVTNLLNGNANLNPIGSIEYFDHEGVRTASSYGVYDKHGQDSWANPQRSIDFIARDEMGYKHALIEKLLPLSDRTEYQRIILRACGDDNYPGIDSSAHMRDIWIQNLAEKEGLNLDVRKGTRIVMYANGQFWGVYSIREKVNDHDFMNYYYGQDRFNLQFLMYWGNLWAEYGGDRALNEWASFKNYMLTSNVNDPVVFENIKNQYDYTSLIDYIIINSFVVCSDWLNWNVGWWRGLNPEGGHLKWGYILWDEDATFGHYVNYTGIPEQIPTVPPCFPENLGPYSDPEQHIEIFNKLRENPEVEQYYLSRYLDLKNTVFVKEDLLVYFDSLRSVIDPEMARHSTRWGGDYLQWRTNTNKVRNFIIARCDYLESGLMSCYNLTGPYDFTMDINAEGQGNGTVKVNTIIPDQYPWSGVYYGGVDMRLEAIPTNNAFVFDHWELTNHAGLISDLSAPVISFNLTSWESVTAHFKPIAYTDSLVINEINYKSSASFDSEDWIEFYNPHETSLDISNWVFKDDDDAHGFVFPTNTIIPSKGYLVLCRDTAMFKTVYPAVLNKIGNMDFGFSSSGEVLRLYNSSGALIDTVHYGVSTPWPSEANGGGSTLELINPAYDNALAASWMASPPAGTPGAMNSLISEIPEYDLSGQNLKLRVQPNPAQTFTMIEVISDQSLNNAKICLFDAFGKEVFSQDNIQSNTIRIPRNNLTSGIYVFRITNNEGKTIGAGKILFN